MQTVQTFAQAYSQAPWRKQMQVIGLFLLALVFVALVAGLYLSVTARAATVGRDIQAMQAEIDRLEQVNADLQSQLAFLISATEMEKRARAMGFRSIEMEEPLYLLVPGFHGRRPLTLAPPPAQVQESPSVFRPEYTESLFVWLQKQLYQSPLPIFEVLQ